MERTQLTCAETGKTIQVLKDVIIDHWEGLVREVIASSKHESSLILKDHVPEILNQLTNILINGKLDGIEIGKSHGFYRAILTRYSFEDLLTEFSLLRETLIDYAYPMGDINCSKLIHKYIDILLKHSAIEFLSAEASRLSSQDQKIGSEIKEIKENPVIETH